MEKLAEYQEALAGLKSSEVLEWAVGEFGADKLALASSFGVEDQLLTHFIAQMKVRPKIFTLDTGRQFEETYKCMAESIKAYGIHYEVYHPDAEKIEKLLAEKGPNSFYESVENRKECCRVRKVEPLQRALNGLSCWITGLRRGQSVTRESLEVITWDEANGLYKLNPLHCCDETNIWDYVKEQNVVYNDLHDQGFPSIGCAPCTRAIQPGEDLRAGRWWWETPEHKECGLHNRNNKAS